MNPSAAFHCVTPPAGAPFSPPHRLRAPTESLTALLTGLLADAPNIPTPISTPNRAICARSSRAHRNRHLNGDLRQKWRRKRAGKVGGWAWGHGWGLRGMTQRIGVTAAKLLTPGAGYPLRAACFTASDMGDFPFGESRCIIAQVRLMMPACQDGENSHPSSRAVGLPETRQFAVYSSFPTANGTTSLTDRCRSLQTTLPRRRDAAPASVSHSDVIARFTDEPRSATFFLPTCGGAT